MNLMTASHQWAVRPADQRFQTLGELAASVQGRRLRSRSADVQVARLSVALQDGHIAVNSQIAPSEPTHWAFTQLAGAVRAPASYLRTLPPELVVENLNYGLKHNAVDPDRKFLTVANEDGLATLQAVTSTTYGRIWDADCVAAVQRIVERSGGKFHNPLAYAHGFAGPTVPSGLYGSDHDVFMFLIDGGSRLEIGPRAKLNRGFICWNSETGAKTFGLMTFLFNECCGNHIIYGATDINQLIVRHTSGGPARFDNEAMPVLEAYMNASARPEELVIRRAQDKLLPADEADLAVYVAPAKFTKTELKESIAAAVREEGECKTLWQLVQGGTAYARGFDFIDARVDLEKRASGLLNLVAE